jgi:5'-nucleotidase / UDP-sugar diphosphatase
MFNVDQFSALVNHFRAEMPERTLVLSSGDNYIPGPIFQSSADPRMAAVIGIPGEGRGETVIQNALGLEASAVGNHDLDTGPEGFAGIISPDGAYPGATFPYLSANIDFASDSNTQPLLVPGGREASTIGNRVAPSAVISVDGERIGLIGAVTPTLPSITSVGNLQLSPAVFQENDAGIAALAAVIQTEVDALRDDGINKVILLSHMQRIQVERALATRLDGVDIIVAGGSNTLLADANDVIRDGDTVQGEYPERYTSATDEPVLLVNVNGDYSYLGRLIVEFNDDGVIDPASLDVAANGAWAAIDAVVEELQAQPVPEVVTIANVLRGILGEIDGEAFGVTEVFLDGRRAQVRSRETNLGNLSADANLWYGALLDPDNPPVISVKNGGGIRAPIGRIVSPAGSTSADVIELLPPVGNDFGKPDGGISQLDIQTAFAFNNGLGLVTMTAGEVWDLMEFSVLGNFSHIAGVVVEFDPNQTARDGGDTNQGAMTTGRRIRRLEVITGPETRDVLVDDGVFIGDDTNTYRVIALDFMNNCAAPETDPRATPNCGSEYPFKGLVNPEFVNIVVDDVTPADRATVLTSRDPNASDFSNTGGEQDALAEYLRAFHADAASAFNVPFDVNERLIPVGSP